MSLDGIEGRGTLSGRVAKPPTFSLSRNLAHWTCLSGSMSDPVVALTCQHQTRGRVRRAWWSHTWGTSWLSPSHLYDCLRGRRLWLL